MGRACPQENIVTLARQQAKIYKIEQEIREAKAAQKLELANTASTKPPHLTGQAIQTRQSVQQQQDLRDDVRDSSRLSLEVHSPSVAAHMHAEAENSLQSQVTPDPPYPDIEMTDALNNTSREAAQQSMWL